MNTDAILIDLEDASDFAGIAVELIKNNNTARAEEALMKALMKIEDAKTKIHGGK